MPQFSNLKQKFDSAFPAETDFVVYTERQLEKIRPLQKLSAAQRFEMRVVANVLPFRVNQYVIDELIDWDNVPDDPMFQLTFPQKGMLIDTHFDQMAKALTSEESQRIKQTATMIRQQLNPHPAGQQVLNVPRLGNEVMHGMQHKYRETLLFFPSQGQVCHSYCTFCFRWAQFVGDKELRFAAKEAEQLHRYLHSHPSISDLLVTGGDPMVMKTSHLTAYLEPLMAKRFDHVQTIRIGSKSLSFWPQRYVTDPDADDLLRLLERLVAAGKHVALMAHYNHWREMETDIAQEAIRRVRATGAVIRTQAPLLRHINDDADVWRALGQGVVDISRGKTTGLRSGPYRTGTVHERRSRQSGSAGHHGSGRRKGLCVALHPGAQSGLGTTSVFRQVRPRGKLVGSTATARRGESIFLSGGISTDAGR